MKEVLLRSPLHRIHMNISLLLATKNDYYKSQISILAQEYAADEYSVQIIDPTRRKSAVEDGVTHFAGMRGLMRAIFSKDVDILHVFGLRLGWFLRVLSFIRPNVRIVVTADDLYDASSKGGVFDVFNRKHTLRKAHALTTSHVSILSRLKELGYIGSLINRISRPKRFAVDSVLLRAYGLRPTRFFLAYIDPEDQAALSTLKSAWKTIPSGIRKDYKLAVLHTNNISGAQLSEEGDMVLLGYQQREVIDALHAGTSATIIPDWSMEMDAIALTAKSYGNLVIRTCAGSEDEVDAFSLAFEKGENEVLAELMLRVMEESAIVSLAGHDARSYVERFHHPHVVAEKYERLYDQLLIDFHGEVITRM